MELNGSNGYQGSPQGTPISPYPHISNSSQQQQQQQQQQQSIPHQPLVPQWTNYQPQPQPQPQPQLQPQLQPQPHMHPQYQQIPPPMNVSVPYTSHPAWNPPQHYSQYAPRHQPYGYRGTPPYQYPVQVEQVNTAPAGPEHTSSYGLTPAQDLTPQQQQQQQQHFESFSRTPLPPYAIATINNSTGKRSRSANEANPTAPKKSFRNSRRRHRNSHLGCATCKSRRIKCDEQLPECRNCIRARLTCAYLALDDTAREALKVAQQAHAVRIQALNLQASAQEHNQQMYLHPYKIEGLPTQILAHPVTQHPPSMIRPLQINLQKPFFLESYQQVPQHQQLQPQQPQPQPQSQLQQAQLPHPSYHRHNTSLSSLSVSQAPENPHTQLLQQASTNSLVTTDANLSPLPRTSDLDNVKRSTTEPNKNSPSTAEPKFSIEQDSYTALAALIKEHKDSPEQGLDDLSKLDGEYIEITLDPNCTKHLNKHWIPYDKAKEQLYASGFENEVLYKEYDLYYVNLLKEATNNIVLFKSLLSNGASLLAQASKREEIRKVANNQLNRDFEITLRFLNKFKIKFTQDVSILPDFFENVSVCFSKFQIFQTSLPITFYGSHSLKDNVELTKRYCEFILDYLRNEFTVFLNQDILDKYKDDALFQRAMLFNDYIHIFIIYFAQCIKSYHTRVYSTFFFEEMLNKFASLKSQIYDKLNEKFKRHYDELVSYMTLINDYSRDVRENGTETNRLKVVFYSLKKFLSILPSESYSCASPLDYESRIVVAYFHATSASLNAIFPETRFYFLYSFSGREGTRASSTILESLKDTTSSAFTPEQAAALAYPKKIIEFFMKRTLIISEFLKDASTFPARIMLDSENKKILANLIQEDQIESFDQEIKESSYPHIDETSNFFNKESNSIVIPSVSLTKSFTNFPLSQTKRFEYLRNSVEKGLTDLDKSLLDKLFECPEDGAATTSMKKESK